MIRFAAWVWFVVGLVCSIAANFYTSGDHKWNTMMAALYVIQMLLALIVLAVLDVRDKTKT